MHTVESLITRLHNESAQQWVTIHKILVPEDINNILNTMGVYVHADVVYFLTKRDAVKFLNILETML